MKALRKNKIKVVHVVTTLGTGGMENGIVNLCNRHDRSNFEVSICCLKSKGEIAKRLRKDVKIFSMGLPEGKPLFHPIKIARLLKKIRPDIVHTHGLAGGSYIGILGAKLAGVPCIINGEHGAFYTKPHQLLLQKILARISNVTLSVSGSLKKKITENLGISGKKILVIPNGVDTQLFTGNYEISEAREDIRIKHGVDIDNESIVAACIGSLKPEKNQRTILEALKEIKKQKSAKKIKFLFIGDGKDRQTLEGFVAANDLEDDLAFLGKRNDVPQLLSLIDILISTSISRHEGMSNVILESFASSLPVVATKSVGTDELVKEGENGFLIDQNDVSGLVQKIKLLSENDSLRISMGRKARNIVTDRYSIARMVGDYEKVYQHFIEGQAT